jgi:hypothetical protein
MQLMKHLCLNVGSTGLTILGGMMMLTAISGTALAIDPPAPEIDPGTITSAMTLLAGSVLLVTGRRFKK